jgi:hypothetical protein
MFSLIEKAVLGMALLRVVSGSIEIMAALLMLKFNQVDKALIINSSLALVGPMVLIATTTIGLVGMSDKISFGKILWILLGVACILIGARSK